MDESYVSETVCAEHMRRVDDENNRQNQRIEKLEKAMDNLTDLTVNVGKLAVSMETMNKELARQGERLEKIEEKPAKRWDTVITGIITAVVGLLIGLLSSGALHP
jgi:archaellum component FlaC